MINKIKSIFVTLFFVLLASTTLQAGEKWDMPMAYSATNFHSMNGVLFANAVRVATGGGGMGHMEDEADKVEATCRDGEGTVMDCCLDDGGYPQPSWSCG